MTNLKTVLIPDESRESPNVPDGLFKGGVFNGDNCAMGIRYQQSGSLLVIWGRMIGNDVTGVCHVPAEQKPSGDMYCLFLKNSIEP